MQKETGNCVVVGRRHDALTLIVAVTAALVLACGCCGTATADPVSPAQVSAAVAAATGTVEKFTVETSPNTEATTFSAQSSDAATSADRPTESQTPATANLQAPIAEDNGYHKVSIADTKKKKKPRDDRVE